jgi:hypothetical protein
MSPLSLPHIDPHHLLIRVMEISYAHDQKR